MPSSAFGIYPVAGVLPKASEARCNAMRYGLFGRDCARGWVGSQETAPMARCEVIKP